jgi:hypothetical protein
VKSISSLQLTHAALKDAVAAVPQHVSLVDRSVAANIAFGLCVLLHAASSFKISGPAIFASPWLAADSHHCDLLSTQPLSMANALPTTCSTCCRDGADEDAVQDAAGRAGLDAAVPQMKSGYATEVSGTHSARSRPHGHIAKRHELAGFEAATLRLTPAPYIVSKPLDTQVH